MGNACSCVETPLPPPPLPGTTDVVYEGYLRILSVGRDVEAAKLPTSWQRRYFILRANGQLSYFKSGSGGTGVEPKGAVFLSDDFFVGDSLLHDYGFQISDLVATTWYMWADNNFLQLKWMTMLGTVLHMLGDRASKPAAPTDAPPSLWDVHAAESVEELVTRSLTMKQANASMRDAKSIADLREQMKHWTSNRSDDSPWHSSRGSQNGSQGSAGSIALARISKRQGSGLFARLSGAAGRAARAAAMHDDNHLRPSQMVAERLEREALFSLGEDEQASSAHLQMMPSMERVDEEAEAEEEEADDAAMEAIKRARISTMEHAARHEETEEAEAHARKAAEEEAEAKAAEEAAQAAAAAADAAKAAAEEEARAQAAQAAKDAAAAEAAAEAARKVAEAEAAAAEAHAREKALHEATAAKEAERHAALEEAAAKRKAEEAAEAEAKAALAAAEAKAAEEKAALEAKEAAAAAQRLLEEQEASPDAAHAEAKKAALARVASTGKAAAEAKAEAEAKAAALAQAEAAKAEQVHIEVGGGTATAAAAADARKPSPGGLGAATGAVKAVKKMTLLQQRAAELEERQRMANEEMKSNPFSKNFDPSARKLKKGDAGYGKAVAGSETEARANKAQAWIEEEISKLIEVLKEFGVEDAATKEVHMSFGELFNRYADISDTLVGILMRGKRRKRILFDSDMLFQGVHDHIVIRLMPA